MSAKPKTELDARIGSIIEKYGQGPYERLLDINPDIDMATYFGNWMSGLFSWNVSQCERILVIGGWFGAFAEFLAMKATKVDIIEADDYRREKTAQRLSGIENVSVISSLDKQSEKYDYILFAIDEKHDEYASLEAYNNQIQMYVSNLTKKGHLFFVVPNAYGTKYLSGEPDGYTNRPYDGITDETSNLYRPTKVELEAMANELKNASFKMFYPFPDARYTQIVYSNEVTPKQDILDRLHIYITNKNTRILNEKKMIEDFAKDERLEFFSNSFFLDFAKDDNLQLSYAVVTADRQRKSAFATTIIPGVRVEKHPMNNEGTATIENLVKNTLELQDRGVLILPLKQVDDYVVMNYINAPNVSQMLQDKADSNSLSKEEVMNLFQDFWQQIQNSSEKFFDEKNEIILEKAYFEMIPVNCFYLDGKLLFFDQEFTFDNCPAKFVMYRVLHDTYKFVKQMEKIWPLDQAMEHFGISNEAWVEYETKEKEFMTHLYCRDNSKRSGYWVSQNQARIRANRRRLTLEQQMNEIDMFDLFNDLGTRKIILFGAGSFARQYLEKHSKEYSPEYIVDNGGEKWGTQLDGIEICNPQRLLDEKDDSYRVIVCVKKYNPILNDLKRLNIPAECIRVFSPTLESLYPARLSETMSDGLYDVGFVTGVFDLFHIGHLNLLRNSKSRCHYLIAGVLTDEIVEQDKHKTPFIPFEERMEIVKQCKYVDRVVAIDQHNTNKIDAWRELRYGCLFAGGDHIGVPYWVNLQKELRHLGSELEFFPYTESTSSTMLQQRIKQELDNK